MHGNRRARWASVVEMFGPHFVVAAEIIHVDEVTRDLHAVRERRAFGREDVANGLDHRAGLLTNVQLRNAQRIDFDARERVVLAPRTGARHKQEISGAADVWKLAARRGFGFEGGGGHSEFGRVSRRCEANPVKSSGWLTALISICSFCMRAPLIWGYHAIL